MAEFVEPAVPHRKKSRAPPGLQEILNRLARVALSNNPRCFYECFADVLDSDFAHRTLLELQCEPYAEIQDAVPGDGVVANFATCIPVDTDSTGGVVLEDTVQSERTSVKQVKFKIDHQLATSFVPNIVSQTTSFTKSHEYATAAPTVDKSESVPIQKSISDYPPSVEAVAKRGSTAMSPGVSTDVQPISRENSETFFDACDQVGILKPADGNSGSDMEAEPVLTAFDSEVYVPLESESKKRKLLESQYVRLTDASSSLLQLVKSMDDDAEFPSDAENPAESADEVQKIPLVGDGSDEDVDEEIAQFDEGLPPPPMTQDLEPDLCQSPGPVVDLANIIQLALHYTEKPLKSFQEIETHPAFDTKFHQWRLLDDDPAVIAAVVSGEKTAPMDDGSVATVTAGSSGIATPNVAAVSMATVDDNGTATLQQSEDCKKLLEDSDDETDNDPSRIPVEIPVTAGKSTQEDDLLAELVVIVPHESTARSQSSVTAVKADSSVGSLSEVDSVPHQILTADVSEHSLEIQQLEDVSEVEEQKYKEAVEEAYGSVREMAKREYKELHEMVDVADKELQAVEHECRQLRERVEVTNEELHVVEEEYRELKEMVEVENEELREVELEYKELHEMVEVACKELQAVEQEYKDVLPPVTVEIKDVAEVLMENVAIAGEVEGQLLLTEADRETSVEVEHLEETGADGEVADHSSGIEVGKTFDNCTLSSKVEVVLKSQEWNHQPEEETGVELDELTDTFSSDLLSSASQASDDGEQSTRNVLLGNSGLVPWTPAEMAGCEEVCDVAFCGTSLAPADDKVETFPRGHPTLETSSLAEAQSAGKSDVEFSGVGMDDWVLSSVPILGKCPAETSRNTDDGESEDKKGQEHTNLTEMLEICTEIAEEIMAGSLDVACGASITPRSELSDSDSIPESMVTRNAEILADGERDEDVQPAGKSEQEIVEEVYVDTDLLVGKAETSSDDELEAFSMCTEIADKIVTTTLDTMYGPYPTLVPPGFSNIQLVPQSENVEILPAETDDGMLEAKLGGESEEVVLSKVVDDNFEALPTDGTMDISEVIENDVENDREITSQMDTLELCTGIANTILTTTLDMVRSLYLTQQSGHVEPESLLESTGNQRFPSDLETGGVDEMPSTGETDEVEICEDEGTGTFPMGGNVETFDMVDGGIEDKDNQESMICQTTALEICAEITDTILTTTLDVVQCPYTASVSGLLEPIDSFVPTTGKAETGIHDMVDTTLMPVSLTDKDQAESADGGSEDKNVHEDESYRTETLEMCTQVVDTVVSAAFDTARDPYLPPPPPEFTDTESIPETGNAKIPLAKSRLSESQDTEWNKMVERKTSEDRFVQELLESCIHLPAPVDDDDTSEEFITEKLPVADESGSMASKKAESLKTESGESLETLSWLATPKPPSAWLLADNEKVAKDPEMEASGSNIPLRRTPSLQDLLATEASIESLGAYALPVIEPLKQPIAVKTGCISYSDQDVGFLEALPSFNIKPQHLQLDDALLTITSFDANDLNKLRSDDDLDVLDQRDDDMEKQMSEAFIRGALSDDTTVDSFPQGMLPTYELSQDDFPHLGIAVHPNLTMPANIPWSNMPDTRRTSLSSSPLPGNRTGTQLGPKRRSSSEFLALSSSLVPIDETVELGDRTTDLDEFLEPGAATESAVVLSPDVQPLSFRRSVETGSRSVGHFAFSSNLSSTHTVLEEDESSELEEREIVVRQSQFETSKVSESAKMTGSYPPTELSQFADKSQETGENSDSSRSDEDSSQKVVSVVQGNDAEEEAYVIPQSAGHHRIETTEFESLNGDNEHGNGCEEAVPTEMQELLNETIESEGDETVLLEIDAVRESSQELSIDEGAQMLLSEDIRVDEKAVENIEGLSSAVPVKIETGDFVKDGNEMLGLEAASGLEEETAPMIDDWIYPQDKASGQTAHEKVEPIGIGQETLATKAQGSEDSKKSSLNQFEKQEMEPCSDENEISTAAFDRIETLEGPLFEVTEPSIKTESVSNPEHRAQSACLLATDFSQSNSSVGMTTNPDTVLDSELIGEKSREMETITATDSELKSSQEGSSAGFAEILKRMRGLVSEQFVESTVSEVSEQFVESTVSEVSHETEPAWNKPTGTTDDFVEKVEFLTRSVFTASEPEAENDQAGILVGKGADDNPVEGDLEKTEASHSQGEKTDWQTEEDTDDFSRQNVDSFPVDELQRAEDTTFVTGTEPGLSVNISDHQSVIDEDQTVKTSESFQDAASLPAADDTTTESEELLPTCEAKKLVIDSFENRSFEMSHETSSSAEETEAIAAGEICDKVTDEVFTKPFQEATALPAADATTKKVKTFPLSDVSVTDIVDKSVGIPDHHQDTVTLPDIVPADDISFDVDDSSDDEFNSSHDTVKSVNIHDDEYLEIILDQDSAGLGMSSTDESFTPPSDLTKEDAAADKLATIVPLTADDRSLIPTSANSSGLNSVDFPEVVGVTQPAEVEVADVNGESPMVLEEKMEEDGVNQRSVLEVLSAEVDPNITIEDEQNKISHYIQTFKQLDETEQLSETEDTNGSYSDYSLEMVTTSAGPLSPKSEETTDVYQSCAEDSNVEVTELSPDTSGEAEKYEMPSEVTDENTEEAGSQAAVVSALVGFYSEAMEMSVLVENDRTRIADEQETLAEEAFEMAGAETPSFPGTIAGAEAAAGITPELTTAKEEKLVIGNLVVGSESHGLMLSAELSVSTVSLDEHEKIETELLSDGETSERVETLAEDRPEAGHTDQSIDEVASMLVSSVSSVTEKIMKDVTTEMQCSEQTIEKFGSVESEISGVDYGSVTEFVSPVQITAAPLASATMSESNSSPPTDYQILSVVFSSSAENLDLREADNNTEASIDTVVTMPFGVTRAFEPSASTAVGNESGITRSDLFPQLAAHNEFHRIKTPSFDADNMSADASGISTSPTDNTPPDPWAPPLPSTLPPSTGFPASSFWNFPSDVLTNQQSMLETMDRFDDSWDRTPARQSTSEESTEHLHEPEIQTFTFTCARKFQQNFPSEIQSTSVDTGLDSDLESLPIPTHPLEPGSEVKDTTVPDAVSSQQYDILPSSEIPSVTTGSLGQQSQSSTTKIPTSSDFDDDDEYF